MVLLGGIVAIVGAIIAAGAIAIIWATPSGVGPGTPQLVLYELVDYAFIGSRGVVGAGVFLAALGLAVHRPRMNILLLLGGTLVLIGTVGSASVSIYMQSLFFGGAFPGVAAVESLSLISTVVSILEPAGFGVMLLGFVLPRSTSWMD